MSWFFIPYLYFYKTRLKSGAKFISWLMIYFLPLYLIVFFNSEEFSWREVGVFLISSIIVYCLYEIGYIYNDTETIKKEMNPTLRLKSCELEYYEKNKYSIYLSRFSLGLLLSTFLYSFFDVSFVFLTYIFSIILLYAIYNNIRSRLNLLFHFLLVTVRYSSPVVLATGGFDFLPIVILAFPLINVIERAGEKRFRIMFFQSKFFKLNVRVKYYFSLLLGLLFFSSYLNEFTFEIQLYVYGYMFTYRCLSPYLYKKWISFRQ